MHCSCKTSRINALLSFVDILVIYAMLGFIKRTKFVKIVNLIKYILNSCNCDIAKCLYGQKYLRNALKAYLKAKLGFSLFMV